MRSNSETGTCPWHTRRSVPRLKAEYRVSTITWPGPATAGGEDRSSAFPGEMYQSADVMGDRASVDGAGPYHGCLAPRHSGALRRSALLCGAQAQFALRTGTKTSP